MADQTLRIIDDFAWAKQLISRHVALAAMRHRVTEIGGNLLVEVEGARYEARAWRAAIDGRIYPSRIDRHGVRHQLVVGTRLCVHIAENPGCESHSNRVS